MPTTPLPPPIPDDHHRPPTILVVFGATGDLMARKLIPALRHMQVDGKWPQRFSVLGLSRSIGTDGEFREHVRTAVATFGHDLPPADDSFLSAFHAVSGDFGTPTFYRTLVAKLDELDLAWGMCTNKLFYLAVPPSAYPPIIHQLAAVHLNEPCSTTTGWTRILIEKPYGSNLAEAERTEQLLTTHFKAEQIYRIDHYLGKQAIQNILSFRFANSFLEPAWDRDHIESIELRLHETLTAKGRGAFYDNVGALLDVGHNHLLEVLALVTMDHPLSVSPAIIWQKREEILTSLEPIHDIDRQTFRAQYDGYKNEAGVRPDSTTETFFRLTTTLNHPHWQGVPITLEAGKAMPDDDKRVIITFKHPEPCLCPPGHHAQSRVEFRIQPHAGMAVQFYSRKPGSDTELQERWMTFDYPTEEGVRYLAEYSQLLTEAIAGNQLLFVSGREALAAWRFVDPIMAAWKKQGSIATYTPGSLPATTATNTTPTSAVKTIGMVGLGKMGANLSLRLKDKGWNVIGFDPQSISIAGMQTVESLPSLVNAIPGQKIIWVMVPNNAVDDVLFGRTGLAALLNRGDIIIDGGNSFYKDSIARAKKLSSHGISYIDIGVSGGPGGARSGPALMVGGEKTVVHSIETLFYDLAQHDGYRFFPGHGAGHFVKMVHNGIEYGMMQAIAEGFAILDKSAYDLDLTTVSEIYNNGSVIESRLMEWLHHAFVLHGQQLNDITGTVAHTGEGLWTVKTATELKVQAKVIADALAFRKTSEQKPSYTGKILSALREQFGGHAAQISPVKKSPIKRRPKK